MVYGWVFQKGVLLLFPNSRLSCLYLFKRSDFAIHLNINSFLSSYTIHTRKSISSMEIDIFNEIVFRRLVCWMRLVD